MEFSDFQKVFASHSKEVLKYDNLFVLDVDKDLLWATYLNGFPPEFNQVYRERREFDCSCCRHFIKNAGALVAITPDYEVVTLWDFDTNDECYQPMLEAMGEFFRSRIQGTFFAKQKVFGAKTTLEQLDKGVKKWHHLYLEVPDKYVTNDVAEKKETCRATAQVFDRSLNELSPESVMIALELIDEKMLYRGDEWKNPLLTFQGLQNDFLSLDDYHRERFVWRQSLKVGGNVARIRNNSVGTLLTDLTGGMEVDQALCRWEGVMAPTNYKRPKAVFTKKMVEEAAKTAEELGLSDSLHRRFATIEDITINNVLWVNKGAKKRGGKLGAFQQLADNVQVNPRNVNAQSINVEDFIQHIGELQSLEVLFEGRHSGNLVSLISPMYESIPLTKWDNGFTWAYNGNIADSMKEQVKAAGGFADGVLRFSIRWNDGNGDTSDYDAHCRTPHGVIYYSNKVVGRGMLDVDIIHPTGVAVENITWREKQDIPVGKYDFFVRCYNARNSQMFDAEIEADGEVFQFTYPHRMNTGEDVAISSVTWNGREFSIKNHLEETAALGKEVWGVGTGVFSPVSTVMFSPNHWDDNAIGNRHYFFMLQNCKNDGQPNGFYNEFLPEGLTKHRKVFEALGSQMKVEKSDVQLSGLGFSTTKRDNLIVRVDGGQILKIIF